MLIKRTNNLTEGALKTYLAFPESAGTATIRPKNTAGFTTTWAYQLGETGQDQTEIIIGTVKAVGSMETSTLSFDHPVDTPIYAIKYNQCVFKVSTTGTSGTSVDITDGTVSIMADSPFTQFDHTAGSASYAYQTYWRNSAGTLTSTLSDWIVGTVPLYALGGIVSRVRSKLWSSDFVTDDEIKDWANEWNERLNNLLVQSNQDYNLGSASIGFSGTADFGTITDEKFKQVRRVWYTENGSDHYAATKMESNTFLPAQTFSPTNPFYYMYGDRVIGRKPHDTSGTFGVVFYQLADKLSNDYDLLPIAARGYTKSYVDYCLIQAQYKDNKLKLDEKIAMENALEDGFRSQIAPRNKSGVSYIDVVDVMQGNDDHWF